MPLKTFQTLISLRTISKLHSRFWYFIPGQCWFFSLSLNPKLSQKCILENFLHSTNVCFSVFPLQSDQDYFPVLYFSHWQCKRETESWRAVSVLSWMSKCTILGSSFQNVIGNICSETKIYSSGKFCAFTLSL